MQTPKQFFADPYLSRYGFPVVEYSQRRREFEKVGEIRVNPYPGGDLEISVHNMRKKEYARVIIQHYQVPEFIALATRGMERALNKQP